MKRTEIRKILNGESTGENVLVKGWVRSLRKSKSFCFVVLNDGSSQKDLQVVVDEEVKNYMDLTTCRTGACIGISGKVVESQGKGQGLELQAHVCEIYGKTDETYPLQKKGTSLEFLREIPHLRGRTNTFGAIFRVRHCLSMATHRFFSDKGFYYLHSPIITGLDAEGAGDVFRVTTFDLEGNIPKKANKKVDYEQDYFAAPSFLAVTGQLEAEAYALSLGKVYTFGPTFRSENSNTTRHLSEFWMIEPEVAFADLEEVAELGIDYLKYMIKAALEECPEEMAIFEKFYEEGLKERLQKVLDSEVTKITYTEAIEVLKKSEHKFEYSPEWGGDLQTEHERYLCETHFTGPVIVTDYPKDIKAFYMKQNNDGKTVRAMDILVPGVGELIGGSQREESIEILKERMAEVGLKEEDYRWYLDLRRYGNAPHSGFGLGFERAMMYITGMSNIRDVIAFPRYPKHL